MERHQIKVQLLDRTFPMMVTSEEEETILLAVKLIEDKIQTYREKFNIRDDQYILLMCCLDLANEFVRSEKDSQQLKNYFSHKLNVMGEMLDSSLSLLKQNT